MTHRRNDHTFLVFCVALFLFVSPLTGWWTRLSLPWYTMYVLWGLVIALIALNQWRGAHRGD